MSLRTYKKKRDFKKTREPAGRVHKGRSRHRFVIQKHAATRLHYDFRLELDGTLKSWAVPKGPSFNPDDRRLAVHVEDHPIEYGSFEGTIPQGQYGGGTVMVWDRGTWESIDGDPSAAYAKGKLKFVLKGRKLSGGWALVRMRSRDDDSKDNWLLIKEHDEYADPQRDIIEEEPDSAASGRSMDEIAGAKRGRVWQSDGKTSAKRAKSTVATKQSTRAKPKPIEVPEISAAQKRAQPSSVKPQLCTLVREVPEGDGWVHETKFDGYRIVAFTKNGKTRLMSRNDKDWTRRFPAIAEAVSALGQDCILDGEVVVLQKDGRSDFQALQNILRSGGTPNVVYFAFDLLHLNGYDLTEVPLSERKAALKELLTGTGRGPIRYSEHIEGEGAAVFKNACRLSMEGVVSKRADSPYLHGRGAYWLKTKCIKSQEFVICGYTPPGGARVKFGALMIGYYEGKELRFAGKVGTGFTHDSLVAIAQQLHTRTRDKSPFVNPPRGPEARGVQWVDPELVCEIEFTEWTTDGRLRHPSFKGLREDKPARKITRELPVKDVEMASKKVARAKKTTATKSAPKPNSATIRGVTITHPDRELYPEGITKLDLVEYYDRMADHILPYLADRPLTLVRCPQGRQQKCFYQKHLTEGMPEHVRGVPIREKEGRAEYIVIDSREGLLELANLGVLEFHVWGSRADDVEHPDTIVFDLDPGPGVSSAQLAQGALLMRDVLDAVGLRTFVKTTGGKGLHVAVPIKPQHTWNQVKEFAHTVALQIAQDDPKRYTANMSLAKRKGKIYLDYLRNGRGATFIVPYSTRAREHATVSMPLRWEEINGKIDPARWTIANTETRLKGLKKDPWVEFLKVRQSLTPALKKLGLA